MPLHTWLEALRYDGFCCPRRSQLPYGLLRLPLGTPPLHGTTAYRLCCSRAPQGGALRPCCRGRDGSLLFHDGLGDRSAPNTPAGSWVLHLQGLRTVHGLRPSGQGSAPACSRSRGVGYDAATGFLSYRPITCSPPTATLSWRFDGRVSPSAGHQLRGCLATTPTGLSPASPSQLVRTHPRPATAAAVPTKSAARRCVRAPR